MDLGGRDWTCVLATRQGPIVVEQWCPHGELPSRTNVMLSRNRWPGYLGARPKKFVSIAAATASEGSPVRPTMRLLHHDRRTAAVLATIENDFLMGDRWQIYLVQQGKDGALICVVEAGGPPPADPGPALELATALVSVPDGIAGAYTGATPDEVREATIRLNLQVAEETLDADLAEVDRVLRAAEALPPTVDANDCLAKLATRLAGAPGAGFLGFTAESLRVHRALLKRTSRRADPVRWAFYAREALLARAELTRAGEMLEVAAACEQVLAASLVSEPDSPPSLVEQTILWRAAAEIFLGAAERPVEAIRKAQYEQAAMASSRSLESARRLGPEIGSFMYAALECRAEAERGLGLAVRERSTLQEALPLAPAAGQARIRARISELSTAADSTLEPHWASFVKERHGDQMAAVLSQRGDRVIHRSPLRRSGGPDGVILVLRPLVTTLTPTVPNRFVAPMRHAWRFDEEPPAMTFEEILSRALGHRFGFVALGAEWEALGVGRLESFDQDSPETPTAWRRTVDLFIREPRLSPVVLVCPSDSPGMQWELDLLAATRDTDQARFFLLPPDVDAGAGRAAWHRARQALAARHLDTPDWSPDGLLFSHDSHGEVAACDTFGAVWDGRFADRLRAYAAKTS